MTWKDPLQGTSSPLPFLSHPVHIFCATRPPHPHHLLGQGGAGQAVIPPCPEGGPAPRSPRGRWAGRSWRQALGAAWRGPGWPGGRAGRWRRRPGGSQTCLTTYHRTPGSCLFRPSYREPSVEYDLLDPLGGDDRVDCGEAPRHLKAIWVHRCLQLACDLGRTLLRGDLWSPHVTRRRMLVDNLLSHF